MIVLDTTVLAYAVGDDHPLRPHGLPGAAGMARVASMRPNDLDRGLELGTERA